jgi:hypothetical protein
MYSTAECNANSLTYFCCFHWITAWRCVLRWLVFDFVRKISDDVISRVRMTSSVLRYKMRLFVKRPLTDCAVRSIKYVTWPCFSADLAISREYVYLRFMPLQLFYYSTPQSSSWGTSAGSVNRQTKQCLSTGTPRHFLVQDSFIIIRCYLWTVLQLKVTKMRLLASPSLLSVRLLACNRSRTAE